MPAGATPDRQEIVPKVARLPGYRAEPKHSSVAGRAVFATLLLELVHVQRGGMRGLVHANCSPTREGEISDPPPSLGVQV